MFPRTSGWQASASSAHRRSSSIGAFRLACRFDAGLAKQHLGQPAALSLWMLDINQWRQRSFVLPSSPRCLPNIDLDRASLRVVESVEQTKGGLRFKAPKTEQAPAVTLPAFAVDELRRLKRQQVETLLQLGVRQTGETLDCCREDGEVLQPTSLTHHSSPI
jgi:hypothetical protein